MQPQKRPLTLTASILNIVSYAIYIVYTLILAYLSYIVLAVAGAIASSGGADQAAVLGAGAGLLIGCLFRFILGIVVLVLSCKCIKISKMSVQDFQSKKGTLLGIFVINIILVAFGIFSLVSGQSQTAYIALDVILWVMMTLSAIFIMIDINKNAKKANEEQANVATETAQPTEAKEETSSIDKIAELNKMKEDGLITKEEFENMKKDLLK